MLIGVDWGGTKIEAIGLSPHGEALARKRIPTPRDNYDACIAAVASLVAEIEAETGLRGSIGFGIPGTISPATGLVKNANATWMNGRALERDLEQALGRPVRVENDANCLAVSEATDGAGAGKAIVWAVILGTGAGSGIAVRGRALSGAHRIAGEWGHNPLPWAREDERPGPRCWCGKDGCLETFISGTGFAREHSARTGRSLSVEEIIAGMRSGDAEAERSYRVFCERLGRGLAHVVNIIDPDVIVLGGGVSNVDELYRDLPGLVAPWVFSDELTTPVVRNRHGDSSGVRGAAWLWRGR